jgi:hypothetical protein
VIHCNPHGRCVGRRGLCLYVVQAQGGCALSGCDGAVLGLCWGRVGAVLGPSWGRDGVVMGPCWGRDGVVLGQYLSRVEAVMGP